jgi:hypothetical protein
LTDDEPVGEVGKEWLGEDHPAVASLRAGVAIHQHRDETQNSMCRAHANQA